MLSEYVKEMLHLQFLLQLQFNNIARFRGG